jgi:DNA-binding SARP family transcriptional activator
LWNARLCLVVAPPGCGKTTLLGQLAGAAAAPVAWHLVEGSDGDVDVFLARLELALAPVIPGLRAPWRDAEDAAHAVNTAIDRRTLLVLDDFHGLQGASAEEATEVLLRHTSPLLSVLIAARVRPAFNLSRLRASGDLVEVGPDELRFRSWEVEQLFRDVYEEPLPPEALADLARRTEGWAAGLQLFRLATQGKSVRERQRILASLGTRWDLAHEYLTRNLLDGLPADVREFLLETCALTRLSGALCDAFLGRAGSQEMLDELERRQIFIQPLADGTYRYHEVLRANLEQALVAATGEAAARARYRKAAGLLESEGALPDAIRAYCRAEAWDEIGRLLGHRGERALGSRAEWLDELPHSVVHDDPWLLLAAARAHRSAGRFAVALSLYKEAEGLFPTGAASSICLQERLSLGAWLDPSAPARTDALGLLRSATVREPLSAQRRAAGSSGVEARLVGGLSALLAGHALAAAEILAAAAEDPAAGPQLAPAARAGAAVALLLAGEPRGLMEAERAAEDAERAGSAFLVRLSRAALALNGTVEGTVEATAARVMSDVQGDRWGCLVATLLEGLGALRRGDDAVVPFESAVDAARALGASVLEAWARAGLALAAARRGDPDSRDAAIQAEVSARVVGAKGAQGVAYLALAECDPAQAPEYEALVRAVEEECGIALLAGMPVNTLDTPPSLELRCFGGFSLAIGGTPVDLTAAKPIARRALRCLAIHAGRPVHREVLIEALWPGGDAVRATRHLQVLISILRHLLEPGVARGESHVILRDGEAYSLDLPADGWADVVQFDRALSEGRLARAQRREDRAVVAFQGAMDVYGGELLPEDGPADWVVEERERRRREACEAAIALAQLLLARGEALSAAVVCERGLGFDRYQDSLWKTCVLAYEQAGDAAAAERARRRYEGVLAELGREPAHTAG